jgi:hypothetical protein
VRWRRAPLSRASWIDDPDAVVALQLRYVSVGVDDGGAARKRGSEALLSSRPRPGVVHHSDPRALDFDDTPFGENGADVRVVHVPGHGLERPERPELLEHCRGHEIARVQHEIRLGQQLQAMAREPPGASREVRVRDDGDEAVGRQRQRLRLGFAFRVGFALGGAATRNGLLTYVFDRVGFISAWSKVAST